MEGCADHAYFLMQNRRSYPRILLQFSIIYNNTFFIIRQVCARYFAYFRWSFPIEMLRIYAKKRRTSAHRLFYNSKLYFRVEIREELYPLSVVFAFHSEC